MVIMLRLRDPEQWPVEVWDVHSVVAKRRSLFYTETVFSPEIKRYNKWLCERTDELTLYELLEVWAHSMWLVYLCYTNPDCDPELRHETLLRLRGHFQEYLKLPERHQEKFWPLWSFWYAKLVAEELVEEGWWDGTA
jgi:hypothetical protein